MLPHQSFFTCSFCRGQGGRGFLRHVCVPLQLVYEFTLIYSFIRSLRSTDTVVQHLLVNETGALQLKTSLGLVLGQSPCHFTSLTHLRTAYPIRGQTSQTKRGMQCSVAVISLYSANKIKYMLRAFTLLDLLNRGAWLQQMKSISSCNSCKLIRNPGLVVYLRTMPSTPLPTCFYPVTLTQHKMFDLIVTSTDF